MTESPNKSGVYAVRYYKSQDWMYAIYNHNDLEPKISWTWRFNNLLRVSQNIEKCKLYTDSYTEWRELNKEEVILLDKYKEENKKKQKELNSNTVTIVYMAIDLERPTRSAECVLIEGDDRIFSGSLTLLKLTYTDGKLTKKEIVK